MRNLTKAFLGLMAAGSMLLTVGCTPGADATATPTPSDTPSATETPTPTPTPTPSITITGTPTPLADINAITVTGEIGKTPSVQAPYPFNVDKTQAKAVIEGNGPEIVDTSIIELSYVGIDAATGQQFDSSFDKGTTMMLQGYQGQFYEMSSSSPMIKGFGESLIGQKSGSRVLMAITSADGYDPDGNTGAGISPGDTLLFIVDVLAVSVGKPVGTQVATGNAWVDVTDTDGVPTAKVKPGVPPPTTLQTTVLIQGTGRAITAEDGIFVSFFTMDYATGAMIENSYADLGAAATPDPTSPFIGTPQYSKLSDLIPGWQQALVGKTIGSRVLIIVPGNLAYPQGNATPSIAPNATLVCVVDILFSFIPPQQ